MKLNIAFHAIESSDLSLKPISAIKENIEKFQYIYPIKIVYLITEKNKNELFDFARYIEENFENIKKLTIGLVRDENDYYNDDVDGVVGFDEYYLLIQDFLDNYGGNLDVDIFAEGYFSSKSLPKSLPNQINRFRCVFSDSKYADCLYDVGEKNRKKFDPKVAIKYCDHEKCPKTGKSRCLTDKIKLKRINNN